jgi:hypothetical protein
MAKQRIRSVFDSDGDNTAQAIKTSAGKLFDLEVSNPNTIDSFLQLFDLATGSITVGSTTPRLSFLVPAAASSTIRGAFDRHFGEDGLDFQAAISYSCTTTPTGSTDPSTGLTVNAIYS